MSIEAYFENIVAKTGKSIDELCGLIAKQNLTKHGEIVAWLKSEFELGHGHANAVVHAYVNPGDAKPTEDKIAGHFTGKKAKWQAPYDDLVAKLSQFGSDFTVDAGKSYVSLLKKAKKIGILQVSADRLDIGIKLKGVAPVGRFEAGEAWNAMVTHRLKVTDPKEIDAEVIGWLKKAYDAA